MSGYLLDTNVLSEFSRRGGPDSRVKQWLEAAYSESLFTSVVTLGEIRFGIELLHPGKRRTQLERWLAHELPEWFEDRILPVDKATFDQWGRLRAQAQLQGRPLPVIDALLAATAFQHRLTLVTRDIGGFSAEGLTVINPWRD